jgi:hypothetical protein
MPSSMKLTGADRAADRAPQIVIDVLGAQND